MNAAFSQVFPFPHNANHASSAFSVRPLCSLGDGTCDDGGVGSDFALCPCGSDCEDCGERDGMAACGWDLREAARPHLDPPFSPEWWRLDSSAEYVLQLIFAMLFLFWNSLIFGVFFPLEQASRLGCGGACLLTLFLAPFMAVGVILPLAAGPVALFFACLPITACALRLVANSAVRRAGGVATRQGPWSRVPVAIRRRAPAGSFTAVMQVRRRCHHRCRTARH